MQADRRPTVTDEVIAINDDLDINYGVFRNGFTFRRAANSWRLWPMLEFVAPRLNPTIAEMYDAGVAWTLYEHVSVVINGWADYVFEGPKGPITQRWMHGLHNVENGGGYLPAGEFTRRFHDDFTLCCVVQKFRRTPGVQYHFEVLTGPAVLDREALFVHYATGARQRQTDFDLPPGHTLDLAAGDIAIIGRLR
ncbi:MULTISPECIES: hypothetical protein [Sphingobium]|uniref:Uncharacterized protein n=1 Tax=Sphingobium baderi LL03 TaxID=1114964 RepID=T0G602_9SPHN|nr:MULTISPECIES: hypothetical protein [Sphingobium]EQA99130.1 hypothetical protein L485_16415 [Sphingobium baderi LL03]KMS61581.1 hypothetical protein V475_14020 [Sphingobium baderi LL03]MDQ4421696.1 hypothetical protein [Sphingobium sp. DEHP117]